MGLLDLGTTGAPAADPNATGLLADQAAAAPAPSSGGGGSGFFGIPLPHINLGLGNALHMALGFPGAVAGIFNDVGNVLAGTDQAGASGKRLEGEGLSLLGSGFGTVGDIASALTLGQGRGLINRVEAPLAKDLTFNPQQEAQFYGAEHPFKQGIVPGLMVDLGNIQAAGAIGKGIASAGDLGSVAEAERTAAAAGAAKITPEMIQNAADSVSASSRTLSKIPIIRRLGTTSPEMADAGQVGAFDYSKITPLLRDAANAYAKAQGAGPVDEAAIASRVRILEALDKMEHPVHAVLQGARALGSSAQDLAASVRVDPNIDQQVAAYNKANGLEPPTPVDATQVLNPEVGSARAKWYAEAQSNPNDPAVRASYDALANDTKKQFDFLQKQGVKIVVDPEVRGPAGPYATVDDMFRDIKDNKTLKVGPTTEDQAHPMPQMNEVAAHDANGVPMTVNDMFRAVHDYFGHSRLENGVGPNGEDVAWQLHQQMFSQAARPALATETAGQNGYLNFSPANLALKAEGKPAEFGPQKAALMPDELANPQLRTANAEAQATTELAAAPGTVTPVTPTGGSAPLGVDPAQAQASAVAKIIDSTLSPEERAGGRPPNAGLPEPISPRTGPVLAQKINEAARPMSPLAQKIVSVLPKSMRDFLASYEGWRQAQDVRMVTSEERRFVQSARLATLHGVAVKEGSVAALQLVDKTLPDGTVITRDMADELVTRHLQNAYNGRQLVGHAIAAGAPAQLQAFIAEKFNLSTPIPSNLITPELKTALDAAGAAWNDSAQTRLGELLGSRRGAEGMNLANKDERPPIPEGLTPAMTKEYRAIQRQYDALDRQTTISDKELIAARADILKRTDKIAALEAGAAKMGERIDASKQAVLDAALPKALGSDVIAVTAQQFVDETNRVTGATLDPHTGEYLIPQAYATPAPDGTPWQPPDIMFRLAGQPGQAERYAVSIEGGVQVPLTEWQANGSGIVQQFIHDHAATLANPDAKLGSWINGNTVHLDISQTTIDGRYLNQGQAYILGMARNQLAYLDMAHGDMTLASDPLASSIAAQYVDQLYRPGSQLNRFLKEQAKTAGKLGLDNPLSSTTLTAQMFDHQTQIFMNAGLEAVRNGTAASLNDFWKQMSMEVRTARQAPPTGSLLQTYLNKPLTAATVAEAEQYLGADSRTAAAWYHEQHDLVENMLGGIKVPIYNTRTGTVEQWDATELLYSIAAVTSKNSGPLGNAANAFSALANYVDYTQMHDLIADFAPRIKAYSDLVQQSVDEGGRFKATSPFTADELFQHLTGKGVIGHMNEVRHDVMEVLSGRPVSEFDNEYIRTRLAPSGEEGRANRAGVTAEATGARFKLNPGSLSERDVMELNGSNAYAKIRSFYENLKSPDTSQGVTLDRVMAELIGLNGGNWNAKGAYAEAAAKLRQVADEVSVAKYGETGHIMPHEMQAMLWAFSKRMVNANDLGRLHAAIGDSLDAVDQGSWSSAHNPMRDQMESDIEFGRTNPVPKGKVGAIPAREVQVRNLPEVAKSTGELQGTATTTETHFHKFAGEDIKLLQEQLGAPAYDHGTPRNWSAVEKEVQASIDAGNPERAKSRLLGYLGSQARRYTNDPQGFDIVNAEPAYFRSSVVARLQDMGWVPKTALQLQREAQTAASDAFLGDAVFQKFHDDSILGATYTSTKTGRTVMAFFQSADPTTLFHESAHALRQFVSPENIATFERSYGAKVGTTAFEEHFADDFIGYMYQRTAPTTALGAAFEQVRQTIGQLWEQVQGHFNQSIDPGVASVLDRWFAPTETGAPVDVSAFDPATKLDRASVAQIVANLPARAAFGSEAGAAAAETPAEALRRGVEAGKAATRAAWQSEGQQRLLRTRDLLVRANDDLKAQIESESLPETRKLAKMTTAADARAERFTTAYGIPANRQVPAAWVPLWSSLQSLHEFARTSADPVMAQALADFPLNFEALVAKAKELAPGFSPTHFANLSDAEVRSLVFDPVKLFQKYDLSGVAAEKAGTRNVRLTGTNRVETLAAMAAAQVQVTHEAATGQIVDYIDTAVRRPVPLDGDGNPVIPAGWKPWDGERRFLLTGQHDSQGNMTLAGAQRHPDFMVPDAVVKTIRSMSNDYQHPIFRLAGKVLSPWRTLILTTNSAFYAHVFFSNAMIATTNGVTLEDWANALVATSAGKEGIVGNAARWLDTHRVPRWADLTPEDIAASKTVGGNYPYPKEYGAGESLVPSAAPQGIHPIAQFKAGRAASEAAQGTIAGVEGAPAATTVADKVIAELKNDSAGVGQIRQSLQKAGMNIHDFARTAIYLSGVRSGLSEEEALMRSYTAAVDYNDMNSFEQNVVKSVVPFYAWQKGLLKIVGKFAVDHPLRAAIMLQIGKMNESYSPNRPDAYAGILHVPGTGVNVNIGKMLMPWTDSLKLLTPQGIMSQANPVVTALVGNGLGAATGGRVTMQRVDEFGHVVPDTSPLQDLSRAVTGAPIFRTLAGVAGGPAGALGLAPAGGGKGGVVSALANFAGVGNYSNTQVKALQDRLAKAEATIASGHSSVYTNKYVKKGRKPRAPKISTPRAHSTRTRVHRASLSHSYRLPSFRSSGG